MDFTLVKTEMISGHSSTLPPGGIMFNRSWECLNLSVNLVYTVACEYRTEKLLYSTFKCPIATISPGLDLSIREEGKLLIRGMSGFQCSHLHKLTWEVVLGMELP